jgi:hypothetical protein
MDPLIGSNERLLLRFLKVPRKKKKIGAMLFCRKL